MSIKMIKKTAILAVLVLLVLSSAFAGGKKEDSKNQEDMEKTVYNFPMPVGFPGISVAYLKADNTVIMNGVDVNYEVVESPDLMGARVLSGDADLFIAPTNLGPVLYNKGVDIKYLGSMVWGVLYIVSTEDLNGWESLRGREIYMLGRGLTPDIVMRTLLKANNLDPEKDVKLKYVQNKTELAPSFIAGKSTISIMPEPSLTMVKKKVKGAKVVLDLQTEWQKMTGSDLSYPQASLYAKGELVKNNPEFISAFLEKYAASINKIVQDPEAAGKKAATYLSTPPAPIIAKSIPGGNLKWVGASKARESLENYLKVLLASNPKTVGGKLPDEDFYYTKK